VSSERIFPGQVYAACEPYREGVRIKVVGWPKGGWGGAPSTVAVATIGSHGRLLRRRDVPCSSLHADRLTFNGVRKTGYYLVVQNG
jgi:hypothetical protein